MASLEFQQKEFLRADCTFYMIFWDPVLSIFFDCKKKSILIIQTKNSSTDYPFHLFLEKCCGLLLQKRFYSWTAFVWDFEAFV